uniref:G-protein coupled receptors family 1 profile domain-containing protein n=1 Tax=Callorhinchus milii TaxID=7868 RepID=A0A4W3IDK9_CALMI
MANETSSPDSSNTTECFDIFHQTMATKRFLPLAYSLIFVTGSIGNILALWIFIKRVRTKSAIHVYLINLIFSNLLLCMIMPFLIAYFAEGQSWLSDSAMCTAVRFATPIFYISLYFTILILCWVALSQYATLTNYSQCQNCPILKKFNHFRILKRFREVPFAKVLCSSVWLTVICVLGPITLYYSITESKYEHREHQESCYNINVEIGASVSGNASFVAIFFFYLCFLVLLALNVSLVYHVYIIQKNSTIEQKHLVYKNVLRKISIIQVMFAICFLPYHIYRPIFLELIPNSDCKQKSLLVEIKNLLIFLAALRSSTDPFVYILLNKSFRLNLCSILQRSQTQSITLSSIHQTAEQSHRKKVTHAHTHVHTVGEN